MIAYKKLDGKWYELVKVDSFNTIEVEVEGPEEAEKPTPVKSDKPTKKAK